MPLVALLVALACMCLIFLNSNGNSDSNGNIKSNDDKADVVMYRAP